MAKILKKLSDCFSGSIEKSFYRHGIIVGSAPYLFIILPFILAGLAVIGIKQQKTETRLDALWVPKGARAESDKNWVLEHFPEQHRFEHVMIVAKDQSEEANVLTKEAILKAAEIRKHINSLKVQHGGETVSWQDVCAKVDGPTSGFPGSTFGDKCIEMNPAGLWDYNATAIKLLEPREIAEKIWLSPVASNRFQNNFNYSTLLARTTFDENGQLKTAGVMLIRWMAQENETTKSWEASFLEYMDNVSPLEGFDILYDAPRNFQDVQESSILDDMMFFYAGYAMVFTYVISVLGKRNCLEFKAPLAIAGLLGVTMSLGITLGICAAIGIPMFTLLQMVPFLSLGLGIDDMFVIVQCHENIMSEYKRSNPKSYRIDNLPVHIGKVMARAGAAISVTSLTNFVAFGIGIFTEIRALGWFCQASCISILSVFFLQATFFPACLLLDIKRQQGSRSAVFCCYKMTNKYKPSSCSQRRLIDIVFQQYLAKYIVKTPTKVAVLIISFVVLGINCYGASMMQRSSDELNVVPSDSAPALFTRANRKYFTAGKYGSAYFGEIDYSMDIQKLEKIRAKLVTIDKTMITKADAWPKDYLEFEKSYNQSVCSRVFSKGKVNFDERIRAFLCCKAPYYRRNFAFKEPFSCDPRVPVPRIHASFIQYEHAFTFSPVERSASIAATHDVLQEVAVKTKSGEIQDIIYSRHYGFWEGEETVIDELFRNLMLASGFVLLTTLLLIASVPACLMVALSVAMTLADALGMLYFLGVSIDTVSSLLLIAAIGLSVDFSAHIAHTFMTIAGDKDERAQATLIDIGPAVFHGGMTTFLAFFLLFFSRAFFFQVFCKAFLSVVVCGLYHGLIFLPVMLTFFGPVPYQTAQPIDHKSSDSDASVEEKYEESTDSEDTPDERKIQDRPDVVVGAEKKLKKKKPPSIYPQEVLLNPKKLQKIKYMVEHGQSVAEKMYYQTTEKKPKRKLPRPDYTSSSNDETSEEWRSHFGSDESLPPYESPRQPKRQEQGIQVNVDSDKTMVNSNSTTSFLTSSLVVTDNGRSWLRTSPLPFRLERSDSESTFRSHCKK